MATSGGICIFFSFEIISLLPASFRHHAWDKMITMMMKLLFLI